MKNNNRQNNHFENFLVGFLSALIAPFLVIFSGGCLVFIFGLALISTLIESYLLEACLSLVVFAFCFGLFSVWSTPRRKEEERLKEEAELKAEIARKKSELEMRRSIQDKARDAADSIQIVNLSSYHELLKNKETDIVNKDERYVLKFVKLGNFLNTKQGGIEELVKLLAEIENEKELTEIEEMVKEQNYILNQLYLYSLNMITALVENKMVLFFSIYEKFDNLGVFNSKWENDLKDALVDMNYNLLNTARSIHDLESHLSNQLAELKDGIKGMEGSVGSLVGSQKYNNLLTAVNTYQNYKTNKRLK